MTKPASTIDSMNIIGIIDLITMALEPTVYLSSVWLTNSQMQQNLFQQSSPSVCLLTRRSSSLLSSLRLLVSCGLEYETFIFKVLLSQAIGWDLELCLISSFCPFFLANTKCKFSSEARGCCVSIVTSDRSGNWLVTRNDGETKRGFGNSG